MTATTFTELLEQLAAAKAGPAQPFTAAQSAHLVRTIERHTDTCDCSDTPDRHPDRHYSHSRRSRASLVDEALYDCGQRDAPPDDARIVCTECDTTHASVGDYTRAMHQLTDECGAPAGCWYGTCTLCPKDVEITA